MALVLLHHRSSYSLFPSCSDPLSKPSTNSCPARRSSRRIFDSGQVADKSLCDRGKANEDLVIVNKKSPVMGVRLIPLKLNSYEENRSRRTSYPSTTSAPISSISPARSQTRKRRPGPVTDLIIVPHTEEEWKVVMEEVKILYLKGQYKHCSMRCKQILDSITDQTHPLYSIYLCFFTASSLEMTARSLHNHSSNKLPLFQEALSFYKKAESFVEYASFSADPNLMHATRRSTHSSSSISSSIRSSVDSVFSQTSNTSISSGPDSPTDTEIPPPLPPKGPPSVSTTSPQIIRMKKKVSFSAKLSTLPSESELLSEETMIDAFPRPPSAEGENAPIPPEKEQQDLCTLSSYLLDQSITRYRTQLTALSKQLAYHVRSIHSQIATLSEIRRTRRSNLPTAFFDGGREASGAMEGVSREEVMKVELRERINRLKERGWKRERFDGERYRILCERALGEVQEGA
ncbi:hypothetical protein N431DRAFT_14197 [Stipitochalara longipes BDJ]|nr:hypothetical protein N431DRAFT_14197 [Stipitochalara longipes BDJ]